MSLDLPAFAWDLLPAVRAAAGWAARAGAEACLVAALVVVAQRLLRDRVSARWRHNLWLLVLARLAMPAAPASVLSPFNLLPALPPLAGTVPAGPPAPALADGSPTADRRAMVAGVVTLVPAPLVELGGRADPISSDQANDAQDPGVGLPPVAAPAGEPDVWTRVEPRPLPPGFHVGPAPAEVTSAPAPALDPPLVSSLAPVEAAAAVRPVEPSPTEGARSRPAVTAAAAPPSATRPLRWFDALAVVWAAVAVGLLARLGWASVRLARCARRLPAVADPAVIAALDDARAALGVRRRPAVLLAPDGCGPGLVGLVRPRVLLPRHVIDRLGPDELRHVLLHELAHLRRGDVAVNWAVAVLRSVHWFNPLLRPAFRRLVEDREQATDEAVLAAVAAGAGAAGSAADPARVRQSYGDTLIRLLELVLTAPAAAPKHAGPAGSGCGGGPALPTAFVGMVGVLEPAPRLAAGRRWRRPRSSAHLDPLHRRIAMIARYDPASPSRRRWSIAGTGVSVLLGGVALTGAVRGQPATSAPPPRPADDGRVPAAATPAGAPGAAEVRGLRTELAAREQEAATAAASLNRALGELKSRGPAVPADAGAVADSIDKLRMTAARAGVEADRVRARLAALGAGSAAGAAGAAAPAQAADAHPADARPGKSAGLADPLADIDVDLARLQLQAARAEADLRRQSVARTRELAQQNVVSNEEARRAEADLIKAEVEQKRAELELKRQELRRQAGVAAAGNTAPSGRAADDDRLAAVEAELAEAQVQAAKTDVQAKKTQLDRTRSVYGSKPTLETDRAEHDLAKATANLRVAELEAKRQELRRQAGRAAPPTAAPLTAAPAADGPPAAFDAEMAELQVQAARSQYDLRKSAAAEARARFESGAVPNQAEALQAQVELAKAEADLRRAELELKRLDVRRQRAAAAAGPAAGATAPTAGNAARAGGGGVGDFGGVEDDATRRANQTAADRLRTPVGGSFDNVPLADALGVIAGAAKVDVLADWLALEAAGVDRAAKVSLKLSGKAPAEQVLRWVLRAATGDEAAFAIDHGAVVVSTRDRLNRVTITRAYDVDGLDPAELSAAVRDLVAPASWGTGGGKVGAWRIMGRRLLVTQTEPNHREIEKLIGLLRKDGRGGGGGDGAAGHAPGMFGGEGAGTAIPGFGRPAGGVGGTAPDSPPAPIAPAPAGDERARRIVEQKARLWKEQYVPKLIVVNGATVNQREVTAEFLAESARLDVATQIPPAPATRPAGVGGLPLVGQVANLRADARRQVSMSNARQILIGLHMYANEYQDKLPTDLRKDVRPYLGASADRVFANPRPGARPEGYVYVRPADTMTAIKDAAGTIVLVEAMADWGDGIVVGFADGHAEFVQDRDALLKRVGAPPAPAGPAPATATRPAGGH